MPQAAPEKTTETRAVAVQQRAAQLVPTTFREADNTIEVIWTTGARRRAYDWSTDQVYEEELAVTPEAVDMTRFEAGTVQVIDGHDTFSGVSAILGIATEGSVRDGQGIARIAFSTDPAKAGVVGDIRAGVIRAMSFGYSVQRYEITRAQDRTDGGNVPLYRAVRWTPMELTFCAVGADPNAAPRSADPTLIRSQQVQGLPCEFVTRAAAQPAPTTTENTMTEAELQAQREQEAATRAAAQTAANEAARAAAEQTALTRAADITDLCQRHGLPQLAGDYIRTGKTTADVGLALLDELAKRDATSGGNRNVSRTQTVTDEVQTRMDGMQEAIMHRVDTRTALSENGRQFRSMTMLELSREFLETRGVNTRGMDRMTVAGEALRFRTGRLGTSDFSTLLANVATKRLRMGYEENPGTYTRWARRAPNAPDFKNISVAQLSATPDLLQVNEHGEFKYSSMSDGGEVYALLTYGRVVSLTRQAIVNDDLRAFDRLVAGFGASAARLENRTVYAQITANANMADGNALFSTAHSNNGTGGGSALQLSALATARAAMRVQKGLMAEELNLQPSFLIVPAALETTAYQLTSSAYVPTTTATINEFRAGGRTALEPIVEPILDANSTAAWYLAAQNSQVDTVEYCYLDGAEGPVMDQEMGFDIDGMSIKCRLDFAAKAIDWRGMYRGVGS